MSQHGSPPMNIEEMARREGRVEPAGRANAGLRKIGSDPDPIFISFFLLTVTDFRDS